MTYAEIIDSVLMDIDEDRTDKTVLEKVKSFINRAYMDLAKREGIEKTIKVTPKQGIVKLPEDFSRIFEVTYMGNLMPYTLRGKEMICNTEKELLLTYNYRPETLINEDDELETSTINSEYIINFAKFLYFSSEQEADQARAAKSELNETFIYAHNRNNFIQPIYNLGGV